MKTKQDKELITRGMSFTLDSKGMKITEEKKYFIVLYCCKVKNVGLYTDLQLTNLNIKNANNHILLWN